MSYRCRRCRVAQPNGTQPNKVVVEQRERYYPNSDRIGIETVTEWDLCNPCSEEVEVRIAAENRVSASDREIPEFDNRPSYWRSGVSYGAEA